MFTKEHEGLLYQILFISAAIAFLALVASGIRVADDLWGIFERQEDAKDIMQNYAAYAAYDETEVRGQELINLAMSSKGNPYLLVIHGGQPFMLVYDDTLDMASYGGYDSNQLETALDVVHYTPATITSKDVSNTLLIVDPHNSEKSNYMMYTTHLVRDISHPGTVVGVVAVSMN